MSLNPTNNYLLANQSMNKNISVVVQIAGLSTLLTNGPIYTIVKYGDPGITYGEPGLVYGGFKKLSGFLDLVSLAGSSLTISQTLEPEQGKGSVSQISLAFIDKNGFMSQVISPGVLIEDILGTTVTVFLGYSNVSYPQDYFQIFRGFVSQVQSKAGLITLQLSDPNLKRRQDLFFQPATTMSYGIDNLTTNIPVVNPNDFFAPILGPNNGYDTAISPYILVDNEFISYGPNSISGGVVSGSVSGSFFVNVTRGARGTTPAPHAAGAAVAGYVQIQDSCIPMALKLMLSGWGGPWITNQPIKALAQTSSSLGLVQNALVLPDGIDAIQSYNVVTGDYITISGSPNPANNGTFTVVAVESISSAQPNQIITLAYPGAGIVTFTAEGPLSTAVFSIRSQFDTYPNECGLMMEPLDVDIQGHLNLQAEFLNDTDDAYSFFINASTSGKDFIESQIYLPVAAYSLTRRGQCSVNITKPPISQSQLVVLNQDSILEPQNITITRAVNSRKFFNEIFWQYDLADDLSTYQSVFDLLDSASLTQIGLSSVLPITADGIRTSLSSNIGATLTTRSQYLLSRYKLGASIINLSVNYGVGSLIEAGDVVGLDGTNLFLTNFNDGSLNFGTQLFEVTNRNLDISTGKVTLGLVSGVGASASDRFGVISPSTVVGVGSTPNILILTDSFSHANPKFPFNEPNKWINYLNQPILVHDTGWTVTGASVIQSINPVNPYQMTISPPLPFSPPSGYVMDIPSYPTTGSIATNNVYKNIHAFTSHRVQISGGVSPFQFVVYPGDSYRFFTGGYCRVHNYQYTQDSLDQQILSISGGLITLKNSMGFTPSGPGVSGQFAPTGAPSGYFCDLIGYVADKGGAYRFI
jgi:hypothetical protein